MLENRSHPGMEFFCPQGKGAAVAEQFPQIKGYSPRNLRRMREFYRTYENQPELMCKAQTLGWTQNAVILDCCETEDCRSFFIALAIEKKLSKLALMKVIDAGKIETAKAKEAIDDACRTCCPVVYGFATEEAVDTTETIETACGAFVTACESLRQGSGLPADKIQHNNCCYGEMVGKLPKPVSSKEQQKRSSHPTSKRSMKLLPFGINYFIKACRLWLMSGLPHGEPPPHRWHDFRTHQPRSAFA